MLCTYIRSRDCVAYNAIYKKKNVICSIMDENNTLQLSFHFSGLAKQQLSPLSASSCCKLFAVVWRQTEATKYHRSWTWARGLQLFFIRWSEVKKKHAVGVASCPVAPRRCSLRHVCTMSAAAVQNLWSSQRVKCSTDNISGRLFQGTLQW